MLNLLKNVREVLKNQKGQGMTEYAVVVALVVAIALVVFDDTGTLSTAIKGVFTSISTKLTGV